MICAATITIGAHVLHCCRAMGTFKGGKVPVPHTHHAWTKLYRDARITIEWIAR